MFFLATFTSLELYKQQMLVTSMVTRGDFPVDFRTQFLRLCEGKFQDVHDLKNGLSLSTCRFKFLRRGFIVSHSFFYGQVVWCRVKTHEAATLQFPKMAVTFGMILPVWSKLGAKIANMWQTRDSLYFWAHEQSRSLLGLPDYIPSSSQIDGNGKSIIKIQMVVQSYKPPFSAGISQLATFYCLPEATSHGYDNIW